MDADTFLAHYGVKGMRWGVRRSVVPGKGGSKPHEDAVRAKEFTTRVRRGSTDALSTQELQALVARMNLEKQYSSLAPPSGGAKAKKFVADILVNAGKQQASKLVNDQATKAVARMLTNR